MEPMDTRRTSRPASWAQAGGFGILALVAWTGCADPVEPPPSLYDDAALAAQIANADGIDGVAPRFSGFVHGEPVEYWILGPAPTRAMPVYRICRPEGDEECAPVDHPPVVDLLPDEDGYSPFTQVHWVQVRRGWSGQFTSFDEIHAYLEANDLPAPRSTSRFEHCLIAADDALLDVGPDGATRGPEASIYVRGLEARCFDFTATRPNRALLPDGDMFIRHVYMLTREDETEPLSEPVRMEDMNGDGDQLDSNNILGAGLEDADYTPLWKVVRVTVPAGLPSIDTTPEYTDATDMFDIAPDYTITARADRIVDHEITDMLVNCPIQSAEGEL